MGFGMKFVLGLLVLGLLVAAPMAEAAEARLVLERADPHPPDHPVDVPESRRAKVPIKVKAILKDFVCAQPATIAVNLVIEFKEEWAGASPNPDSTVIDIATGEPGPQEKQAPGKNEMALDIFWGENRPKTGAQMEYTLTTKDTSINGACVPSTPVTGGQIRIKAQGEDILEDPTNQTCAVDDPLCATTDPIEPKGDSPGPGAVLLAMGLAALAVALRRRRA